MEVFDYATAQKRMIVDGQRVARLAWAKGEYVFYGRPNCIKASPEVLQALAAENFQGADSCYGCFWMRDAKKVVNAGWRPDFDRYAKDWYVLAP